jgi:hypothetical protein
MELLLSFLSSRKEKRKLKERGPQKDLATCPQSHSQSNTEIGTTASFHDSGLPSHETEGWREERTKL